MYMSGSGMSYVPKRHVAGMRKSSMIEAVPKFPPLAPSSIEGINGSALAVPPPKEAPERPEREEKTHSISTRNISPRRQVTLSSKSDSNSHYSVRSDDSEKARELKDALARERQLKQQLMTLQKVSDDLKVQVKDKDKVMLDLQQEHEKQEQYYKKLYEKEKGAHGDTSATLGRTQQDLADVTKQLEAAREQFDLDMAQLRETLEKQISEVTEEKDKEIAIRDQKIGNLKKQMAEALKGNSWERQQQLDELTKELNRVQEECDSLRFKIKSLQKSSVKAGCGNCESLQGQVSMSQRGLQERDQRIKELNTVCSQFEKQLKQQDVLLRQFSADNKAAKPK